MTIRLRKILQYAIYGSVLSVVTLAISFFGDTKKADQSYTRAVGNPMEIPTAQADVPSNDGYYGEGDGDGGDCEGEGEGEGEGECA